MEQMEYNPFFRWFVGLSANEPGWHPTVFMKSRCRLLEGAVAEEFFSLNVEQARNKRLLSDDHFTLEGVFGWMKTIPLQRKTRFRGLERGGRMFTSAAAYNLIRMLNEAATA